MFFGNAFFLCFDNKLFCPFDYPVDSFVHRSFRVGDCQVIAGHIKNQFADVVLALAPMAFLGDEVDGCRKNPFVVAG